MKSIEDCWGTDELTGRANGGTQLMLRGLWDRLAPEEREAVQIIPSRVRTVATDRPAILWLHDLAQDPENEHLYEDDLRMRFAKLVFVSQWQFEQFRNRYGIRYQDSAILFNAIDPIEVHTKPDPKDGLNLIYHTTPHRGLHLLVPAVEYLVEQKGMNLHLDVYSSFAAYGWEERDQPFEKLFDYIRSKPYMTYHGFQPNTVVREALKKAHIFAFPSIWQETSCIAAIEAMSAGCEVMVPNYGALTETCYPFGTFYHWDERDEHHMHIFVSTLRLSIEHYNDGADNIRRKNQAGYISRAFGWDYRIAQWKALIRGVLNQTR